MSVGLFDFADLVHFTIFNHNFDWCVNSGSYAKNQFT